MLSQLAAVVRRMVGNLPADKITRTLSMLLLLPVSPAGTRPLLPPASTLPGQHPGLLIVAGSWEQHAWGEMLHLPQHNSSCFFSPNSEPAYI
jgi:hypothetical protein